MIAFELEGFRACPLSGSNLNWFSRPTQHEALFLRANLWSTSTFSSSLSIVWLQLKLVLTTNSTQTFLLQVGGT